MFSVNWPKCYFIPINYIMTGQGCNCLRGLSEDWSYITIWCQEGLGWSRWNLCSLLYILLLLERQSGSSSALSLQGLSRGSQGLGAKVWDPSVLAKEGRVSQHGRAGNGFSIFFCAPTPTKPVLGCLLPSHILPALGSNMQRSSSNWATFLYQKLELNAKLALGGPGALY